MRIPFSGDMNMDWINRNAGVIIVAAMLLMGIVLIAVLAMQRSRMRAEREQLLRQLRRENEIQGRGVEMLNQSVGQSVQQMAEITTALDRRMEDLSRRSAQELTEMRRLVGEKLDVRLNESFSIVGKQLADVHRGIGEMRDLAANVSDLKKVLGNVKTRGVWGEVQLRNVLSEMFAPNQYIENAAIPAGSQTRVEFALLLPDQNGASVLLPIDSKFPQEDYIRLVEAETTGDAAARDKCVHALERAVMEQAKTIAEKYVRPPQTADFAVMFLPSEGLYAECARIPGLCERAQTKYRVLIAGPGTLCALLTSLQMGFRTSELEKRSGEILTLLDEIAQEFTRFQDSIARTRQRLDQAGAELDAMETRARKIAKRLK